MRTLHTRLLTTWLLDRITPAPENMVWQVVRKHLRYTMSDAALAAVFLLISAVPLLPLVSYVWWASLAVLFVVAGFPVFLMADLPRILRPLGPAFFAAPVTGADVRQA